MIYRRAEKTENHAIIALADELSADSEVSREDWDKFDSVMTKSRF